ncbi:TonB-dependent siderophore receptor [Bradyrhizobium sp.]|uniref:TonB-dependent siderophore receptor n=1 Tax=Bradyrhizobium sp. TaxID=376 RepID=UPI0039E4F6AD
MIETPASISVVTQDQIQAQAAQSASEAVRYVAGVRTEFTGSDRRFDNVYVRGFQVDNYLDGMRLTAAGYANVNVDPYNLERIEVLKGPASILYGAGSPGGIVDMVSKKPKFEPYNEMFVSTGSYGRIQAGIDSTGPLDKNKEWAYRLTASGFNTGTQVDNVDYQRVSIAPSLMWRPDNNTSVTLLGTYQRDPKAGYFAFLPLTGTLNPFPNGSRVPTNFYAGEPSTDQMKRETGSIGYLAEHRFDNGLTVRQNLRYTDVSSYFRSVYPYATDATLPNTLDRFSFYEGDHTRTFTVDNQVEAKFRTGPFQHTTLFGIDYRDGTFDYRAGSPAGAVPTISVTNPVYGLSIPLNPTGGANQTFSQVGFYAQDQIKVDRWVALLGVRWDHAQTTTLPVDALGTVGTTPTSRLDDAATTKRAALLYKFDNGISPYIQYTESFSPEFGTDFFGNAFKPTTGKMEEAGIKYQPDPKSLYSIAFYNLVQQNVVTADLDPSHAFASVQTGEIRSRGIELEGKTEVTRSLALLASYTYLDNVITKSNTAIEVGRRQAGMPMHSASLWADYTFRSGALDGFGVAGGVRYIGDQDVGIDTATVLTNPAVTVFDAAMHYDFSALGPQYKGYKLQLNATNLFDKIYFGQCQDRGCYYGLRRQVIATLRYQW